MVGPSAFSGLYQNVLSARLLAQFRRLDAEGEANTSMWLRVGASERSGPSILQPALQRLAQLQALERDWDSYGALPLTLTALSRADALMRKTVELYGAMAGSRVAPSEVMPIADGGISVEWQGAHAELHLDIGPSGALSYLLIERTESGRTFDEQYDVFDQHALDLVRRVIGS